MDDETLVGSARSPQTSPRSTSTMTSPWTFASGGTSTLATGRRRPFNLVDVVSELKRSDEHHAGALRFITVVGIMESGVDRANGFCDDCPL